MNAKALFLTLCATNERQQIHRIKAYWSS